MIKIPPAILSDGLAKHELNQLINMENLLAHIVNRHGQNFLSVTVIGTFLVPGECMAIVEVDDVVS